jgi:exodeoxyribonuclease V beta subunit
VAPSIVTPEVLAPATTEFPDHGDPAAPAPLEKAVARGMFAFVKGARAGTCLHEILERCDFQSVGDSEADRIVTEALRRHGLEEPGAGSTDPKRAVAEMLRELVACKLPGAGFTLAEVAREARLNEWQFYVPMASVSQGRLAQCFARHGKGEIGEKYPAALHALGEREVEGFLTGFVDLVFTHGERWYVVDWKSNHLGNDPSDYDGDALARAMRDHHYILQYHLYTLALHRYLGQRLRGYDYERHFGGVYYAFLRAIRSGAPTGWYVDRPPLSLVDALDSVMTGASE